MFAYLEGRLAEQTHREAERNALLEAYALHARALFDFLHHRPNKGRPVLAIHFVRDEMAWKRAKGKTPAVLERVKLRVGQEVAHLTYDRLDVGPEAKSWNIAEISAALRAGLVTLLAHARDEFPPILIGPESVPNGLTISTGTTETSTSMLTVITLTNERRS